MPTYLDSTASILLVTILLVSLSSLHFEEERCTRFYFEYNNIKDKVIVFSLGHSA